MSKLYFVTADAEGYVQSTHFMPFDEKHGLGKTAEELALEGALVDASDYAEITHEEGKISRQRLVGNTVVLEFEDAPVEPEVLDPTAQMAEMQLALAEMAAEIETLKNK